MTHATLARDPLTVTPPTAVVTDAQLPGHSKRDGVIPAHPGGGALQLSANRWIVFFAGLDPRGWDANHSILYQLRADRPTGRVIARGIIDPSVENWDPLSCGDRLFKSCGMPIAFGVPKGATQNGLPLPHANVFAVKWYRVAQALRDGAILQPNDESHTTWPMNQRWPEGYAIQNQTFRLEWMQFRLNDREDDIEPLAGPTLLCEAGFCGSEHYCSLGPGYKINHAMKPPVPTDPSARQWIDVNTFTPYSGNTTGQMGLAAVRYAFNPKTGLYEWSQTGALRLLPDRSCGECSVNLIGDTWIIAARSFRPDGDTCWFRTRDPLRTLGQPTVTPCPHGPRTVFLCGDGRLRQFGHTRNRSPLYCWEVNLKDFSLNNKTLIVDAHSSGMPFHMPFIDMPKLSPPDGSDRQTLLYRVITRRQTACHYDTEQPISPEEHREAGIYSSDLIYTRPTEPMWEF